MALAASAPLPVTAMRSQHPSVAPRAAVRAVLLTVALAIRPATRLMAQPPPALPAALPSQTDAQPVAHAARRTGAVRIDGRLDESAWAAATPITQFTQQQPDEGRPASERTDIRILYDDQALYIGARLYERGGGRAVRGTLTRRDGLLDDNGTGLTSDKIAVVLDPFRDRNTRVWFELNPFGVRGDQLNGDASWDPVWEGAAHVDSLGWTAEFRIPLSQLRFQGGAARGAPRDSAGGDVLSSWGLEIWRYVTRRNEQDMWAFWRRNEAGGPAYFGTLTGLALAAPPRQTEIVPYVVSGDRFAAVAAGDPFHRTQQRTTRVGADAKFLLTPSLTLDATVNPDFGQVEADPATVNLSAYETFYQEKRPFFVNNANYFRFGEFNCFFCSNVSSLDVFYSRRIGRAPQLTGAVSDAAQYVDAPDVTSILGAATVTGRTRSGWTVGVLDALTGRATARYVPVASTAPAGGVGVGSVVAPPVLRQQVEPLTNYFLGRLRKDLRGGDTRVGGVLTLTTRALGDSLARADLRARAVVAGADVAHYWKDRTYSFLAQVAASDVGGDTAAIRGTERSSAHYFQRPDRRVRSDGLFGAAYDPARTSLGGYALYARLAKDNGDWQWETTQNWRSPGFEVNDLAYLNRADYRWMLANVQRVWTTPTRWYRFAASAVGVQQQFDFDGDRNDAEAHGGAYVQLRNYWSANLSAIHHPATLDDQLTRGGPVVRRFGYDFLAGNVNTDARRAVVVNLSARRVAGIASDGRSTTLSPGVTLKPSSRVLLSLSPTYGHDVNAQQYVTAVADSTTPTGFAGQRYVFATIDQRTLALDTRLNTTFTPSLTLELYAQPFLASGTYDRFKEFAAPRTLDMRVYGRDLGTICRQPDRSYVIDPAGTPGAPCVTTAAGASARGFAVADPNFNVRSLRGTAVLRWEYRPGSTLFAVWSQQRRGAAAYGDFAFDRDRAALFRDRPVNVFQLKATYWLGR